MHFSFDCLLCFSFSPCPFLIIRCGGFDNHQHTPVALSSCKKKAYHTYSGVLGRLGERLYPARFFICILGVVFGTAFVGFCIHSVRSVPFFHTTHPFLWWQCILTGAWDKIGLDVGETMRLCFVLAFHGSV